MPMNALEKTALSHFPKENVVDTGKVVIAAKLGGSRSDRLASLSIADTGKWIVWNTAVWDRVLALAAAGELWGEVQAGRIKNDEDEHPIMVFCPKDQVSLAAGILREHGVTDAMAWKPDTSTRDGVHTSDGDMFYLFEGSSEVIRNPGFTGRNTFPL